MIINLSSFIRYCFLSAWLISSAAICSAQSKEATVKVSAKNVAGYDLTYHRSHNGVWLSTFTPINLDSDSTCIFKMPTEGIERMMILANDPNRKLPGAYKAFYVMPGITEVSIDPLADDKVIISTPSGNCLDGKAADMDDMVYDVWFTLATGGKDRLGISSDTVPASVSAKLLDATPGCARLWYASYAAPISPNSAQSSTI